MKFSHFHSQVAARATIAKANSLIMVDAAVAATGARAATWWERDVLPLTRSRRDTEPSRLAASIREGLLRFWGSVAADLARRLEKQIRWSWEEGYQVLVDVLPPAYWLRLASARGVSLEEGIEFGAGSQPEAARTLFTPMTPERIRSIMFEPPATARDGLDWRQRIDRWSKLVTEHAAIADHLAIGLRKGENPRETAKRILPYVQENKAAAERIARTEMLRVSQESMRQQWDQFGDLIAGYQILATLDLRTRPHHRSRSGDLYLYPDDDGRLPEGAKGTPDQRPIVPDEPNCRCHESPVMKELPGVFKDVVRKDREVASMDGPVEDPVVASRWFDVQDEERKKTILGRKRYETIADNLEKAGFGRNVSWADTVEPGSGKFALVRDIADEETVATAARRGSNEVIFQQRAALLAADRPELFPGLKLIPNPPATPAPPLDLGAPIPPVVPPSITPGQARAIQDWQTGDYEVTRDYYSQEGYENWQRPVSKSWVGKEVRKIDAGLARLPFRQTRAGGPVTVYRGIRGLTERDLNRLLVQKSLEWDNYQAAALLRRVGEAYAEGGPGSSNVLFRIRSATGRDLTVLGGRGAQEGTVLFERGRRFRVTKVTIERTKNGGRLYVIDLEDARPAKDPPLFTGSTAPRKRLWEAPPLRLPRRPSPPAR